MKAVVMAGGEGSRLRPLTSRRPKPLAPIANKPVMEHIVDSARAVTASPRSSRRSTTSPTRSKATSATDRDFGVRMSYVVEDTPLGTAGAVKMAEQLSERRTVRHDLRRRADRHRPRRAARGPSRASGATRRSRCSA